MKKTLLISLLIFASLFSLSQKELAKKMGIHYTMYGKIEQNVSKEPTIWTMIKIADALNVSLDELVGRKVKKKGFNVLPPNSRLR